MFRWLRNRKRKQFLNQAWPEKWSLHFNRNVRLTWRMDDSERLELQQRMKVFVNEKNWEGCHGLEITDEIKVTIAAQACLMLLGVEDFYFGNVKSILVFPQAFRRQTKSGWIMDETVHAGEAWQGGPIVLSWKDALQGGRNEDDGQNLVVHEFAHALDGLDGEMGGSVQFETAADREDWPALIEREFLDLCQAKQQGRRTLLDHYGATNHAEFFAVASETFFEQPRQLRTEHSELFRLLKAYYRIDPAKWQSD